MRRCKYLILGAGPAGLSVAHRLLERGEENFVVLEKEAVAGGLCRSTEVDGAPLDIGGGHFLDTVRPAVLEFLFQFLPAAAWQRHERKSTIAIHGEEIDYPFEANLWQLPVDMQVEYLESIARAGCNLGEALPAKFSNWIRWKLGDRIAEDYMLPYNRKIWSIELDRLGTYWLYKLPNVSFRDTLLSCLERKQAGKMPAHASFFYPKQGGYGEVWKRMGEALGERLVAGCPVTSIDVAQRVVNGEYQATERIISTIPWTEWLEAAKEGLPVAVRDAIGKFEYASVQVAYEPGSDNGNAHWTYVPDETTPHHRLLNRYNFCPGARGHWTETNAKRVQHTAEWAYTSKYSYPLNTIGKPEAVKTVLDWATTRQITGLGRWGEWEHMNSDVAVEQGMELGDRLSGAGRT